MTQKIVRLENWSVREGMFGLYRNSTAILQSDGGVSFSGLVYGHPKFHDGDGPIYTTRVIMTNGKKAVTKNTQYDLGDVNPEYDEWMKENHPEGWDPENPKFGD